MSIEFDRVDDSKQTIVKRLKSQWNALPEALKRPYQVLVEEDYKHYNEVMKQEEKK